MVGYDEAHKDVVPFADIATLSTSWGLPTGYNASADISAPVLVVIGAQDAIFCTDPPVLDCSQPGELLATEQPYYSSSSLSVGVVDDTGHDIALHPSADQSFAEINQWIMSHLAVPNPDRSAGRTNSQG